MKGEEATDVCMKECFVQLKRLDGGRYEQPEVVAGRPPRSNEWEDKYLNIHDNERYDMLAENSCNNLTKRGTIKHKNTQRKPLLKCAGGSPKSSMVSIRRGQNIRDHKYNAWETKYLSNQKDEHYDSMAITPSVTDLTNPCVVSLETLEQDKENKVNEHRTLKRKETLKKPFSKSAIPGVLPKSSAIHLPSTHEKGQHNDVGWGSKRLKIQEHEFCDLLSTKPCSTDIIKPCVVVLDKLEDHTVTPDLAFEKESTPEKALPRKTLVEDEKICEEAPLPLSELDGLHDKEEEIDTRDATVSPRDDDHLPSYGFLSHVWNHLSNWMTGN